MRGRAFRRFADKLHKAKALQRLKTLWRAGPSERFSTRRVGAAAATPAPCSCPACGNPRRHFGETTMCERRARHDFETQLGDLTTPA